MLACYLWYYYHLRVMNRGIEVLSPSSYLQNSNWLFQESKGTNWTPEENKRFENALALYDKDPDRWIKVAALIPGKTVGDVIKQYRELEEDVCVIESGLIPVPGYITSSSSSSPFTLEWVNDNQGFDDDDGFNQFGKRGASTRPSEHERKKGVPWTKEEHRQFLLGLEKYGKGDWRNISRNFVTTRTPTQVASHAQKYFIRQLTGGKDKRRSSIHDITMVNLPETKSHSSESNNTLPEMNPHAQNQKFSGLVKQEFDLKLLSSYEGMPMVLSSTNGNMFMTPQEQQYLLKGTLQYGFQFGPL